jgi:hypothetical protein
LVKQAEYVASSLRYLTNELQRLLSVVVLAFVPELSLLSSYQRREELDALLDLLAGLSEVAPAQMQSEVDGLYRHVQLALPYLTSFAERLDAVQQKAIEEIGPQAVHLIGWAWLRRTILGEHSQLKAADFPQEWSESVSALLCAWVLRPFLAVHHCLSAPMLARFSVWHNHRVAPRGLHQGQSPLQRSGLQKLATDWLVTLGYPPACATPAVRRLRTVKAEQEVLAA